MNEPSDQRAPIRRADATDSEFQRSLLQAINDASPDGILVVDGRGIIVSHNARFVELLRIPRHIISGAQPGSAVGASDDPILASVLDRVKDRDGFLKRVQELYADQHAVDHCEIELKDGRTLERDSTALHGLHDQYLGRVWFFRDVTGRKQTEALLQDQAHQDPLTGIMNRRYFVERANLEFSRAARYETPLSVVTFDIDHFKRINDRHGHAAGDELLKTVCNASSAIIRKTNLFARTGGEEFAVLLAGSDIAGATRFAELLRAAVAAARLVVDGNEIGCTISLGVAARRPDDRSVDDCLQRADHAMYRAKANGRNCVAVEA